MFEHNGTTTTQQTRQLAFSDPFENRFGEGHRLPRGLREEAADMSWSLFTATYCPSPATRITQLESTRLRAGKFHFRGELVTHSKTDTPRHTSADITATGPVSACTHMLADAGRYVEILTFRQTRLFEATVTFVEVAHQHDHTRTAWAVGFGSTTESSVAAALSSGAQRIHG